jgi:hypothetical protein
MRGAPQETLDAVFGLIERAAIAGERCPTKDQVAAFLTEQGLPRRGDSAHDITAALARAGRVALTVHANNWRVAEILAGPNAGKKTKGHPSRGRAYLVVDRDGPRRIEA